MAAPTHGHEDEGHSDSSAYETRDVKLRPLAVFAVGITVLIVFTLLVVLWAFRLFNAEQAARDALSATSSRARPAAAASADEQMAWPEPRVQSHPADDLKAFRTEEDAVLTSYGWVDRGSGVVRVPIDVAMQLVLKEGLPARQPAIPQAVPRPPISEPAAATPAHAAAPGGEKQKRRSP